jgi:general secretion pathway protein G
MALRKGFTLVELLVVVMILGALAAIAVPRMVTGAQTAKINACKANIHTMNSQLEMWYGDHGSWPGTLSDVTGNTDYFPDGAPLCPFGTAYSYNSTSHRVVPHNHTKVSSPPHITPLPVSPVL